MTRIKWLVADGTPQHNQAWSICENAAECLNAIKKLPAEEQRLSLFLHVSFDSVSVAEAQLARASAAGVAGKGSAQWMFRRKLIPGRCGNLLAYYNPLRWSNMSTLSGVLRQLEELPVKQQPVNVNIEFPNFGEVLPKVVEFVNAEESTIDKGHEAISDKENEAVSGKAEKLQISEYFLQPQFENVPALARKVLSYWLGASYKGGDGSDVAAEQYHLWFGKSDDTDKEIKALFEDLLVAVADGKYDSWQEHPLGVVALVILMDQFPRYIYRNTARSFGYDWKASEVTWTAIERKVDDELNVMERVWLYLVFTHSEDLAMQKECVELAKTKLATMESGFQKMWIIIFEKHLQVIEQFGRFPHRNKFMHRNYAEGEEEFVNDPKYRFDLPINLSEDPETGAKKFEFITG